MPNKKDTPTESIRTDNTKSGLTLGMTTPSNKIIKDNIPYRLESIKKILGGNELEPLINFDDNIDTEKYIGKSMDDNDSGESYDTRIVLKKKVHDFTNIISQTGGKLTYIKSGTTGHTFKGVTKDYEYAVKVVAYSKKEKLGNINDIRRPENAEILMIKVLSYFIVKRVTPHIALPIGTFNTSIKTFVNLIEKKSVPEGVEKYKEFVEKYKNGEYHDNVSILISEWANKGDLLDFIRNNYKKFEPKHWKAIFFQILSVLAVIQSKYPSFRHNDLKANNILVTKISRTTQTIKYKVQYTNYRVPNIGYQIKLWDFDFACIPGIVDNYKVCQEWTRAINVIPDQNRYYDMHYFFNTLIRKPFFPQFMEEDIIPQEAKDFVNRIVPLKYQTGKNVHKRGRILSTEEYLTPDEVLKNDIYFEEYRKKKNSNIKGGQTIDKFLSSSIKRDNNDDKKIKPKQEKIKEKIYKSNINKFLKDKNDSEESGSIILVNSD